MTRKRKSNHPIKLQQNTQTVVTGQSVSYSEMHVGPLPPARDLVFLQQNAPEVFDRVMSFAEREQENQAKFTEKIIDGNCFYMKASLMLCFAVVFIYMAFLFYLAYLEHETALQYAIVTGLVAGIPAVIYSLTGIKRKPPENGQQQ